MECTKNGRGKNNTCKCEKCEKSRKKARLRAEKDELMRSLGLTKVRGAISGKIYWE